CPFPFPTDRLLPAGASLPPRLPPLRLYEALVAFAGPPGLLSVQSVAFPVPAARRLRPLWPVPTARCFPVCVPSTVCHWRVRPKGGIPFLAGISAAGF